MRWVVAATSVLLASPVVLTQSAADQQQQQQQQQQQDEAWSQSPGTRSLADPPKKYYTATCPTPAVATVSISNTVATSAIDITDGHDALVPWYTALNFDSPSSRFNRRNVSGSQGPAVRVTNLFALTLAKSRTHAAYPKIGRHFLAGTATRIPGINSQIYSLPGESAAKSNDDDEHERMRPLRVRFNVPALVKGDGQIYPLVPTVCDDRCVGGRVAMPKEYAVFRNGGCLAPPETPTYVTLCSGEPFDPDRRVPTAITLGTAFGGGTWHFPIEAVVGLADHDEWLQANPDVKVHVHTNSSFVLEWLDLVANVPPERVVAGTQYVDTLYAPRLGKCGGNYGYQLAWVRNQLLRRGVIEGNTPATAASIVLVNRSPDGRALVNEDKVQHALKKLADQWQMKLEVFQNGQLPPVRGQLELFAQAAVVVMPHGASGMNLVACAPGTGVVEIVDLVYPNTCVMDLARRLHLRYFGLTSQYFKPNIGDIVGSVRAILSERQQAATER